MIYVLAEFVSVPRLQCANVGMVSSVGVGPAVILDYFITKRKKLN
jgi:hypothetical protein